MEDVTASGMRARVKAPAVDGRANRAVEALLAKRLGLPKSCLTVTHGLAGRTKTIEVEGLSREEIVSALTAGTPRPRGDAE